VFIYIFSGKDYNWKNRVIGMVNVYQKFETIIWFVCHQYSLKQKRKTKRRREDMWCPTQNSH
jgi:hypothetical protein